MYEANENETGRYSNRDLVKMSSFITWNCTDVLGVCKQQWSMHNAVKLLHSQININMTQCLITFDTGSLEEIYLVRDALSETWSSFTSYGSYCFIFSS